MKYDHTEKFFEAARRERLTSAEKERMRSFLVAYMEHMPVRTPARTAKTPWFIGLIGLLRPLPLIAFSLVLILSTGVVFAAEQTVPGDILYPIKVSFTEEARAALASSPEKQALWAVERAERRISEAALLAAASRLTPEIRETLDAYVEKHTQDAQRIAIGSNEARAALTDAQSNEHERELAARIQSRIAAAEKARDRIIRASTRVALAARVEAAPEPVSEIAFMAAVADPIPEPEIVPARTELKHATEEVRGRVTGLIETVQERTKNADRFVERLEKRFGKDAAEFARERFNEAEKERMVGTSAFTEGRLEEAEERFERSLELMLVAQEHGLDTKEDMPVSDVSTSTPINATTTATTSPQTQVETGSDDETPSRAKRLERLQRTLE